jgi:ABC-type multidrug transport system fused ATPase/permease subunit
MSRQRRFSPLPSELGLARTWKGVFYIFQYSQRAWYLVWTTDRVLTLVLATLTVLAGILPAAVAWVGKWIVDGVVQENSPQVVLSYVALEGGIIGLQAGIRQGLMACQSLLRVLLGQRVNVLILEKALTLELKDFEDATVYDKMTRARQEASSRPLSLVMGSFSLLQNLLSLVAYGGVLITFSGWAVGILILAALPVFIAETHFAGEAFRLFRWQAPETRQQTYLETLIAREDYAREVKLFQLGSMLLNRYREIFQRLFSEGKKLTLQRGYWSYGLGLLSTITFYIAYSWIVLETLSQQISLGDMTLYLTVFRQGQTALASVLSGVGSLYEDNLYLSNLYEFLEYPVSLSLGEATKGLLPGDGIRFENVTFHYPGSSRPALNQVSLHIRPGEKVALVGKNGSGKTTFINLLVRMYMPDSGRILLDGLDLKEWDLYTLHQRIGIIFQQFVRYQFSAGENIGVGNVEYLLDEDRWDQAAEKGMAKPFLLELPRGYQSQLGKWFKEGHELSGGQWQKIALSRAFMRSQADILVLDEPTAAMDAEAEVEIFERFRLLTQNQMAILISHRFSTVRMADRIVVMEAGEIVEQGSHAELVALGGRYAHLFSLQALGYQ